MPQVVKDVLELGVCAIMAGGMFAWGMVSGSSVMRVMSASRASNPVGFWLGQGFWLLFALFFAITALAVAFGFARP